jgi:hypothetical protein
MLEVLWLICVLIGAFALLGIFPGPRTKNHDEN